MFFIIFDLIFMVNWIFCLVGVINYEMVLIFGLFVLKLIVEMVVNFFVCSLLYNVFISWVLILLVIFIFFIVYVFISYYFWVNK